MIASEHKSARIVVGLFLIGLLLVSAYVLFQLFSPDTTKLKIGGQRFVTEVANTPAKREMGLSGRKELPKDHAMLFSFDSTNDECFWMRDMQFNIDIVWLDDENKVTAIERNVSPSSYPHNFCHSGKYIIEFAAGTTDRLHIAIGDHADL